jgi:rubrerythrin
MRFEQTADLLLYVKQIHEEIAKAYVKLAEVVPDRRRRMLLDYMAVREGGTAQWVGTYAKDSGDVALREFDPAMLNIGEIRGKVEKELTPESSTDAIVDFGLEVHNWFLALYEALLAKSKTPELQEIFKNLRDRTIKGKEKLARNSNMLMDF